MTTPLIISHRTAPAYAPENSLEGIRVTFEQGADGVEIDLRTSLDLRSFLLHDNTMRRTTGWRLPIELTPASIVRKQRLRGDGGMGAYGHAGMTASGAPVLRDESRSFTGEDGLLKLPDSPGTAGNDGETVPTLEEAIAGLPADRLLAVDVKTPWSVFDLVRTIKHHGLQSRTLVWCSSERVVRYTVSHLPGVEVAFYKDYEDGPSNIEFIGKAARIGAHAVSLDWRAIGKLSVDTAHDLGLKVYSWHKELPVTREKIDCGLDGVITDHPARVREVIEGFKS